MDIKFIKLVRKLLIFAFTVLFLFFTNIVCALGTSAAGIIEPTGTQGDVGRIESEYLAPDPGLDEPTGSISDTSLSNQLTGSESQNENSVSTESEVNTKEFTEEKVNNDVFLDINSGRNDIAENSSVGSLSTGQIDSTVNLINVSGSTFAPGSSIGVESLDGTSLESFDISQNNIPLRILFPDSVFGTDAINSTTGNDSFNINNIDNRNLVSFITDQEILRKNLVEILANTGENDVESNTSVGVIKTGDVNLGVNIINLSNILPGLFAGIDVWSILGGLNGDIILPSANNEFTGSDSQNVNNIDGSTLVDAEVDSVIENNNVIDITTNTGENSLSKNTEVGDISTGETQVKGSITNLVSDMPVFYIINVFGKFLGDVASLGKNFLINQIDGSSIGGLGFGNDIDSGNSEIIVNGQNQLTGPSSLNVNNVDNSNEFLVDSKTTSQNDNKIKINANTGKNNLASNTFVEGLKTGSINIISNIVNAAAFLTGKVKLGIINIFGDWKGNLVDDSIVAAKPEEIVDQVPEPIQTDEEMVPAEIYPAEPRPLRVLGAAFEYPAILPISGIPWEEEINNENIPNDKINKIPPFVIPAAGVLFLLSVCGEMILRKRRVGTDKSSTK